MAKLVLYNLFLKHKVNKGIKKIYLRQHGVKLFLDLVVILANDVTIRRKTV